MTGDDRRLADKRKNLTAAMQRARRWHESYGRQVAKMSESELDRLLAFYATPVHVY